MNTPPKRKVKEVLGRLGRVAPLKTTGERASSMPRMVSSEGTKASSHISAILISTPLIGSRLPAQIRNENSAGPVRSTRSEKRSPGPSVEPNFSASRSRNTGSLPSSSATSFKAQSSCRTPGTTGKPGK